MQSVLGNANDVDMLNVHLVLEIRSGPHEGAVFPIDAGRNARRGRVTRKSTGSVILGRCADACDFALSDDPYVSER